METVHLFRHISDCIRYSASKFGRYSFNLDKEHLLAAIRSVTNSAIPGSSAKENWSRPIGNSSDLAFNIIYTCQSASDTTGNKLKTHTVEFTLKL